MRHVVRDEDGAVSRRVLLGISVSIATRCVKGLYVVIVCVDHYLDDAAVSASRGLVKLLFALTVRLHCVMMMGVLLVRLSLHVLLGGVSVLVRLGCVVNTVQGVHPYDYAAKDVLSVSVLWVVVARQSHAFLVQGGTGLVDCVLFHFREGRVIILVGVVSSLHGLSLYVLFH